MRGIVGVDLGGTNIVVGTVSEDGRALVGFEQRSTPVAQGPKACVTRIVDMVGSSLDRARREWGEVEVLGVGMGSPGPIDTARGIVITSPNLHWQNVPLRDLVAERVNLPCRLDNDASCAVLGEWWRGAAQNADVVIGLTIGTGVGGGIVFDGKIFHGASDVASEFGHMTIDLTGRRCGCGNYGCLEAYASGPAIAARAIEGIEAGMDTTLPSYVGGDLDKLTAQIIYGAANDGDELALEVVRDTARFLGAGVANIVNIFNPELIVLCGGVTAAGDRLFGPLRQEVKRRAFKSASDACQIIPGQLQGTAGVYGAVAMFQAMMAVER